VSASKANGHAGWRSWTLHGLACADAGADDGQEAFVGNQGGGTVGAGYAGACGCGTGALGAGAAGGIPQRIDVHRLYAYNGS
jgi:hypothetical protein